jgi:hypothetical protein
MPAKFRNAYATLRFGDGPAGRPYQRQETSNAQHSTPNAEALNLKLENFSPEP